MPRGRSFGQHKWCAGKRLVASHGLESEADVDFSLDRAVTSAASVRPYYQARWSIYCIAHCRTLDREVLMNFLLQTNDHIRTNRVMGGTRLEKESRCSLHYLSTVLG